MKRTLIRLAALAMLLIPGWAPGIAGAQPVAARHATRPHVTFLNPGKADETFWLLTSQTMAAAARQLNIDLEIVYAERNRQALQRLGKEIIERPVKPDYLVLVNEEAAAVPLVTAADAAGIKVLLFSSTLTGNDAQRFGEPRTELKNWIGSLLFDMRSAGYRMAKALVEDARARKAAGNDGKIHLLALGGDERTPTSIDRNAGFNDYVSNQPDVVVDRFLYANWNAADAESLAGRYLDWAQRSGIRMAGVWAANDPMALGTIEAADKRGLKAGRDYGAVGLNWSPAAIEKVRNGEMILTDGGHFFGGAWTMVMLRDFADGCDFAVPSSQLTVQTSALDRQIPDAVVDLIRDRQFDRIPYRTFLAPRSACGQYNFSIARILEVTAGALAR